MPKKISKLAGFGCPRMYTLSSDAAESSPISEHAGGDGDGDAHPHYSAFFPR